MVHSTSSIKISKWKHTEANSRRLTMNDQKWAKPQSYQWNLMTIIIINWNISQMVFGKFQVASDWSNTLNNFNKSMRENRSKMLRLIFFANHKQFLSENKTYLWCFDVLTDFIDFQKLFHNATKKETIS